MGVKIAEAQGNHQMLLSFSMTCQPTSLYPFCVEVLHFIEYTAESYHSKLCQKSQNNEKMRLHEESVYNHILKPLN